MKKFFIIFFIAAFLVAFVIKSQLVLTPAQPQNPPSYEPSAATFLGEYVCLPFRDKNGPRTLACAYGLKLQDNTHIALDLSAVTSAPDYRTGSKLLVKGLYVPIQQISSNHWQKYNINGILQVKEVIQQ